ncbi:hypothetical protein RB598_002875 [Gaeumannomyces tritici]
MADRQAARQPQGISRARPPVSSSVRRNLFQSQLTRRPTPTSSGESETLRLDADAPAESSDIVVRDKNGEVELDDPPTPPIDDPEEIALDPRQQSESGCFPFFVTTPCFPPRGTKLLTGVCASAPRSEERQRLADVVKHHQINQNSVPAQPEEILEAVRASLRAKVAALSEDNWMFEREEPPRYS